MAKHIRAEGTNPVKGDAGKGARGARAAERDEPRSMTTVTWSMATAIMSMRTASPATSPSRPIAMIP